MGKKGISVIAGGLLAFILLLGSASWCRAELRLGLTAERISALGGEAVLHQLRTALSAGLNEPVLIRILASDEQLLQWLERFRVLDLGLVAPPAADRQPAGRFFVIGHWSAQETVFLLRQGLPAQRRIKIQDLVAGAEPARSFSPPQPAPALAGWPDREVAPPAAPNEIREQAVRMARDGALDEALERLHELHRAYPAEPAIGYDYLVVLGWAERDEDAVALAKNLPLAEAPAYVLEAAGKALRNTGRFAEAVELYTQAWARHPEHIDFAQGRAYALAETGDFAEAWRQVATLRARYPQKLWPLRTAIYVAKQQKDYPQVLDLSQSLLDVAPIDAEALREQILALEALGASHRALDYATAHPELLTAEEWRRLKTARAAHHVRWGTLAPESEDRRFAETDQALALIEQNLAALDPADPDARPFILQGRCDRLVALRDRVRMDEAVAEYQRLQKEGAVIPPYALQAAADAFLYERQPEIARDLYLRVLEQQPDEFSAQLSLFYAYVETEDFERATALADALREQQQIWRRVGGPNSDRLDADIAAALARVFGDDLAAAQLRFEALGEQAPRNPDLIRERANVYAARGWPRQALETAQAGLRVAPDHLGLQMGQAAGRLDLHDFTGAQAEIEDIYRRYPENRQAQRLQRRWETHQMRELQADTAYADNSGAEPSGRELRLDSTLYSPPFLTRYRAFLSNFWSKADFPEGQGIYHRYGGGLEYRGRDLSGTVEVHGNHSDGDEVGLALAGRWALDDHWSFPLTFELFSRDTPLRALRNGIDADAARFGVDYHFSESRQIGVSGQFMDFSDGNRRRQLSGYLHQRLITAPHYKLDGRLDLGSGSNSRSDGPYFSPEQDFSAELTLDNFWLLYRRYGFSFGHRLALSGGNYWQQDYGNHAVGALRYEHNWQAYERFALDYGAIWRQRAYDGEKETGMEYFMRLGWRF